MRTLLGRLALAVIFSLASQDLSAQAEADRHNVFIPIAVRAHAPRVLHTQTLLPDGRVLLAGGFSNLQGLLPLGNKDLEIFDPTTGHFTVIGTMPTIRAAHTATVLDDKRVVFIGGSASTVVEAFDPQTGRLSAMGHILNARAEHAATLLPDGRILITGGIQAHLFYHEGRFEMHTKVVDVVELFDTRTGLSKPLQTRNPVCRGGHTQTLLRDGTVLIVGGDWAGTAVLFDPVTGTFKDTGHPLMSREDHQATLLADGRVLITGGSLHGKSLATAEIYDPVSQRFSLLRSVMSAAREDLTATMLGDGRILLTGGEDNQAGPQRRDVVLRAADLFDPSTNTFMRLDELTSERDDHRATLLNDGRVFIFGGQTTSETVLDTGELFIP